MRSKKNLLVLPLLLFLAQNTISLLYANEGPPPAQVTLYKVKAVDAPIKIALPTILMGKEEVEIRAKIAGTVLSKNFVDGASVVAGQSLFSLDAAPLEASVARHKADLEALKARYDQAVRNLRRVNALKSGRAIAQKDVDDAVSAKAIAKADILLGKPALKKLS